ncbi:MAG: hypothetical protein KDD04_06600 [Sinomicrobium sp.]|nr:hypothetical protein [Sinomicrobium sp.]
MYFKTNAPIPEILRNSLNEILEKRDYTIIAMKKDMASEAVIGELLNGAKISEDTVATVYELIRYGMAKCDKITGLYIGLKNIISTYYTKAVEVR